MSADSPERNGGNQHYHQNARTAHLGNAGKAIEGIKADDNGDQKGEVNMDEMTTKELDRLADWLTAQGFTAEQVLDCLKYISGTSQPK